MSTWTWTFIKPEYLSKNQIHKLLEDAIKYPGGIYYRNYKEHGWDYELKDWLRQHKKNYDYFVNICGVPKSEMTEEYLTKELKNRIDVCERNIKYYNMIIEDKMSFREMLDNTKENDITNYGYNHNFYIIERNGEPYVSIKHEWWRNQRDSEDEFNTVESLIEEVKKSNRLSYYDEEIKEWVKEDKLIPKLEKKLREFYGNIGDGNFIVHFA